MRPAPQRRTLRRNAGVVRPAMGAMKSRRSSCRPPTASGRSSGSPGPAPAGGRPCPLTPGTPVTPAASAPLLAPHHDLDAAQREELVDLLDHVRVPGDHVGEPAGGDDGAALPELRPDRVHHALDL